MVLTVKEFIERWADGEEDDVDVHDDVCGGEEINVCYCGCIRLTAEGKKHFMDVLNYTIDVNDSCDDVPWAIVNVDGEEGVWQEKLKKAKEFFYSAAGYCSDENYTKWFKEVG